MTEHYGSCSLQADDVSISEQFFLNRRTLKRKVTVNSFSSVSSMALPNGTNLPSAEPEMKKAWWHSRLRGAIPSIDTSPYRPSVNIVDLFSGCGGFATGIKWACEAVGVRPVIKACVEIEPRAFAVYRHNLRPLLPLRENAANLVDYDRCSTFSTYDHEISPPRVISRKLAELRSNVDLLIAGPPCGGNSNFNNRTRRLDNRNEFYVVAAVSAIALDAKIVIIENVTEVRRAHQQVVERAERILGEAGYKLSQTETILQASWFGTPQRRKRHFLIASKTSDFDACEALSKIRCPEITAMEAIEDLIGIDAKSDFDRPGKLSPENESRVRYLIAKDLYELPNSERPVCHREGHSYPSVYGRLYPHKPAQTLTSGFLSPGRGRFTHPIEPRGLTLHEGARLQGFPDDFNFSPKMAKDIGKSATAKLIGDAVPPQLGYAVGLLALSLF